MKRVAAAIGALLIAGASSAPAFAVTQTGAIKFGWTVPSTFTAHLASDYSPGQTSFQNGTGTIQTSTSTGSGTCTTPGGDHTTDYSLTFGNITPSTGATGCNYQNAIGISVNTNDALGYNIYETLDVTSIPTNYGICISKANGGSSSANTPNTPNSSSAPGAATFNGSGQATACAVGTLLGPASGTVTNPGVGGDVGGAGASDTTTPTSGAFFTVAAGAPASGTVFYGEDVQLNIPAAAPSVSNAAHAIILYFVPG